MPKQKKSLYYIRKGEFFWEKYYEGKIKEEKKN